jgi:hypothetical protein
MRENFLTLFQKLWAFHTFFAPCETTNEAENHYKSGVFETASLISAAARLNG